MKIIVVSDNHGDRQIIKEIIDKYQENVDLMVHCGDSEMMVDDPLFKQMPTVQGNMDYGQRFVTQRLFQLEGLNVLVTHGHLQNVNFTMNNLGLLAQAQHANLVTFGHTHRLGVTFQDHVLYVNPGSISLPRGEYAHLGGTYAQVEVSKQQFVVQYCNRSLKPVPELKFEFER